MVPPDAYLSFGSAVPLVLLGAGLLFVRPHRVPQVFFSLFAIGFGAQIGLMHYGRLLPDADVARIGLLAGHAVMAVATLFLVHFALSVRRRKYDWTLTWAFLVVAAVANLVLVLRPTAIVADVALTQAGTIATTWGPLALPLFQAPQRLAFLLALFVMYTEYRRAKAGSPRRRIRGILIAFALFVTYSNTQFLLFHVAQPGQIIEFASGAVTTAGEISDGALTVLFLVLTLAIAGLVVHMTLRPPPPEGIDSPLVFAFVFPAVVATGEFLLGRAGIDVVSGGFWIILSTAVIVYTLAHYQLFGLELKMKKYAGPVVAGVLVLFGIPLLLTLALGEFGFRPVVFALVPQVMGVAGIVLFQERVKSALFPGVDESPDYMHQRKLEIYRVAMEDTIQRGGSPDDEQLKELRLRHGITHQEHSIVAWMVSSEHRRPGGQEVRFEPGSTVLERYRLTRPLGRGSYGQTFLAYDNETRREVVLKTVDTKTFDGAAARLLLREARLAASLDHPYVIDILDVAELPDRAVVVMEYADNGNLEDDLRRNGSFDLAKGVRFLRELLLALEAVHEHRIVHRNLKPKNILLEADGSVRLSDFGAAQATKKSAEQTELAKRTLQDVLYQSPEQLQDQQATPRSDLFVAGVLFHEVLTRRHPFPVQGKDDHRIRTTITRGKPELHTKSPGDWVDRFLEKTLATDPRERHPDARTMRLELERLAGIPDTDGRSPHGTPAGTGAKAT